MTATFVTKRKARERRKRLRRDVVVAAALLPPALLAAAAFTPLLDVDRVRVTGLHRVAASRVDDLTRTVRGEPMVTADLGALRRRVAGLPGIARVEVRRHWPSTLDVVVVERVPAIGVPRAGQVDLYDVTGALVATVAADPATPLLTVPSGTPSADVVTAAIALLRALPPPMRAQVRGLRADGPNALSFRLSDGATVLWGGGDRVAEKVAVLRLLARQHAKQYDLRVPDRPAVTPR